MPPKTKSTSPDIMADANEIASAGGVFAGYPDTAAPDKFKEAYPLLSALRRPAGADDETPPKLRITCSVEEGFRRGGMRHAFGTVEHELEGFTPDDIEAILGESSLKVELI